MTDAATGPVLIRPSPDPDTLLQLRRGTYPEPWCGVEVIGVLGIAVLLGYKTRAGAPAERTVHGLASSDPHFPPPAFVTGLRSNVLLYPIDDVRAYAIKAGRLHPDGVTPRRLKAHRGPSRAGRTA